MFDPDPYADNILVQGLGPILSREQVYAKLLYRPPVTTHPGEIPKHLRLHHLMSLRDLHIPSQEGGRVLETIDLMTRQGYRYRDPRSVATWRELGGEIPAEKLPRSPATAAVAVGHSGTGKTQAIWRALDCYPSQVITHDSFPRLVGRHAQVVWLSVDVPATGRSTDLAANLMTAWDEIMAGHIPESPPRFAANLARDRRDGQKMLDEWRQVARSHFLGVLHLDEVQNFFKLATLKQRRRRKGSPTEVPELAVVEDQCLRWILSLLNTWGIPVILSGTPDGVGALTKRLSTTQRVATGGFHKFSPFSGPDCPEFRDVFFANLHRYQYVRHPLSNSPESRKLVYDLSAGVPRIIMALWVAAHRVAMERKDDDLRLEDFRKAANTLLSPLMPAVEALKSADPILMARYDDLMTLDDGFWESTWKAA